MSFQEIVDRSEGGDTERLLLSGRVVLTEEALQLGLINRLLPPDSLLEQTIDELVRSGKELSKIIPLVYGVASFVAKRSSVSHSGWPTARARAGQWRSPSRPTIQKARPSPAV